MNHRYARALAFTSTTLAVAIAAATILGPLVLGVIDYRVGPDVVNQVVGGDAIGLFLVVPTALAAAIGALRRHRLAPMLALGPSAFAIYVYAQIGMGADFASQPGNSERFFLLYLAAFVAGCATFAISWRALGVDGVAEPSRRMRRILVGVIVAVVVFLVFGLHLRGVVELIDGPPYGIEYSQSPALFIMVKFMDLGMVVPVSILAVVALSRRWPGAGRAALAVVGWSAMLVSAVAGMAIVMEVNDDPAATPAIAVGFTAFAFVFLVLYALMLRQTVGNGASSHQAPLAREKP